VSLDAVFTLLDLTRTLIILRSFRNWLGGSPLNRLSWLRNSPPFLNSIIKAPSTRWVLFQNGQPLIFTPKSPGSDSVKQTTKGQGLARLPTSSILSLLGPEPFIGQGQNDGENGAEGVSVLEAARLRGLPIVFLGVEEESSANENHTSSAGAGALPSSEFSAKENDAKAIAEKVKGTPYFALDVSGVKEEETKKIFEELQEGDFTFSEARSAAMGKFDEFEAAVFSEARSMLDWNTRNKVSLLYRHDRTQLRLADLMVHSSVRHVAHLYTHYGQGGSYPARPCFHG
jgi:NAD+ diphosphatase